MLKRVAPRLFGVAPFMSMPVQPYDAAAARVGVIPSDAAAYDDDPSRKRSAAP